MMGNMKKERNKNDKLKNKGGITLVALIITIIVMLILVAVIIQVLIDSRLLQVGETAAQEYKGQQEKEATMNDAKVNGYNTIEEYLESINTTPEEETKVQWDGPVASGFEAGDGSYSNPYRIANESQLAYLAKIVNEGENCNNMYFSILQNISLQGYEWVPIGNNSNRYFNGNFDFRCVECRKIIYTK